MSVVNISRAGDLTDGLEFSIPGFVGGVTITRFVPVVQVAPAGGALVIRIQDETGATPANFIEVTIADGLFSGSAIGSVPIAAGGTIYVRVVTANGAAWLGGFFETTEGILPGTGLLTTLADVKTYLGITTSTNDALLTALISGVSSAMQDWMSRSITPQVALTAELHTPRPASSSLFLKQIPVASIEAVRINRVSPITLTADTDYVFEGNSGELIRIGAYWPRGPQEVSVDYTAGFAVIPASLQTICQKQVGYEFKKTAAKGDALGEQSTILESGAQATHIISDWIHGATNIMRVYRRHRL